MKTLLIACAASLAIAVPAFADTNGMSPGKELAKIVFGSIEDNPDGLADMGEFTSFGNSIFSSMDADDSGNITPEEFKEWDFGFTFIAEDKGQQRAYDTAQKILFAVWDRDGDGKISRTEYHRAMVADFRRADIDDNAFLTEEEFLKGYIVNRAYRAALSGN